MFTLRRYNVDLEIQLICCGLTILILEIQFFFKQLILLVQEIQCMGIMKNTILNFKVLSKNRDTWYFSSINSSSWNNANKLFCFLPWNKMFIFCCGMVIACTPHGNLLRQYTIHIVSLNHYICLSIWVVCYCIKASSL